MAGTADADADTEAATGATGAEIVGVGADELLEAVGTATEAETAGAWTEAAVGAGPVLFELLHEVRTAKAITSVFFMP